VDCSSARHDPPCHATRPISSCDLVHFIVRFGSFRTLKKPISQANMNLFATYLLFIQTIERPAHCNYMVLCSEMKELCRVLPQSVQDPQMKYNNMYARPCCHTVMKKSCPHGVHLGVKHCLYVSLLGYECLPSLVIIEDSYFRYSALRFINYFYLLMHIITYITRGRM